MIKVSTTDSKRVFHELFYIVSLMLVFKVLLDNV